MKKGKLIVIDGTDGSGKATQIKLLAKKLEKDGYRVKVEDFPQYGHKSAGPVEDYLIGMFGDAKKLGAYIPSLFYAIDRFAAAERIRKHLAHGDIVICNRYVTANLAHQGSKIANRKQRETFFKWETLLEYEFFKIPKPNFELILRIPAKLAQKLVKTRGSRFYLGNKRLDIHESDLQHLQAAEEVYMDLVKRFKYPLVEGYENGKLLTPEAIHEKVYAIIKKIL
jgi:dTMP kinase